MRGARCSRCPPAAPQRYARARRAPPRANGREFALDRLLRVPDDPPQPTAAHDPAPAPSADDHDESLVRWYLSLTPAQRLDVLNANINAILRARAAQGLG